MIKNHYIFLESCPPNLPVTVKDLSKEGKKKSKMSLVASGVLKTIACVASGIALAGAAVAALAFINLSLVKMKDNRAELNTDWYRCLPMNEDVKASCWIRRS